MPSKVQIKRKDNGQYDLAGLNERQFEATMQLIEKQKAKARRVANNTISPKLLRSKDLKELAKLANKPDGEAWTVDDLVKLEKNKRAHEKKYGKSNQGVLASAIFANSRDDDVKRANNQVDDKSGITQANINTIKDNIVSFRVKASEKHGADFHKVRIRFEDWGTRMENAAPNTKGYRTAAKRTVKGRVSIDCSCGRHQYWYRYLATTGNYCVAPPKEYSPPKVRNPDFTGMACKHVLHVLNKVQLQTWINYIGGQMERQASAIGGGSLRKLVVKDDDAKKQAKLQRKKIDVEEHATRYNRYKERQHKLGKKLIVDAAKIDVVRKRAIKARKLANQAMKRADRAEKKLNQQSKMNRELTKYSYGVFKDANKNLKLSESKLREGFSKKFGMSVKELGDLLDG